MKDKFLLRIAIAVVGVLALAFTAVGIMGWNQSPVSTRAGAPAPAQVTMQGQGQPPAAQPVVQNSMPPNLVNAVQVSDLMGLAHDVHLANFQASAPDKDQWKQAIPKAQALLTGACDCEERNWLNNFVTTGNYALTGDSKYADSAKFLTTLPKDDDEATTHKVAPLPE